MARPCADRVGRLRGGRLRPGRLAKPGRRDSEPGGEQPVRAVRGAKDRGDRPRSRNSKLVADRFPLRYFFLHPFLDYFRRARRRLAERLPRVARIE